jgi:hypothetical protein
MKKMNKQIIFLGILSLFLIPLIYAEPTNGGWSEYFDYCAGDTTITRYCNNPIPADGGTNCVVDTYRVRYCSKYYSEWWRSKICKTHSYKNIAWLTGTTSGGISYEYLPVVWDDIWGSIDTYNINPDKVRCPSSFGQPTECATGSICKKIYHRGDSISGLYIGRTCYEITNNHDLNDYFVPLNSFDEFSAFMKNKPEGVVITNCQVASSSSGSSSGSGSGSGGSPTPYTSAGQSYLPASTSLPTDNPNYIPPSSDPIIIDSFAEPEITITDYTPTYTIPSRIISLNEEVMQYPGEFELADSTGSTSIPSTYYSTEQEDWYY